MVKKPFIRVQRSRSGTFMMFVFVYFTEVDGQEVKHQKYFSCSAFEVSNYINNKNKALFLIADPMIDKNSPQYKAWLRNHKALQDKIKRSKESADAPITTRMPFDS